jgi:hypothetical protein
MSAARAAFRRLRSAAYSIRWAADPPATRRRGRAYLQNAIGRRRYRVLSEAELLATRTSDTAFVFGSGRSLVDISPEEWERIAACNTVSLREFPRQRFVRADYHMTGEVDDLDSYARRIRENPLYRDTIFLVQGGWFAESGNALVGRALLPPGSRIFRYSRTSRGLYSPPSRTFQEGFVHGYNSIVSATNFAILMGWRRIVLAGVDLYNKEYFWLPKGETRAYEKPGIVASSLFTSHELTIEMLGRWRRELEPEGIQLLVYDPRSLLARELPVLSWDEA